MLSHIGNVRSIAEYMHSASAEMKRILNFVLRLKDASSSRNVVLQLVDMVLHKLLMNVGPRDYYIYEFYKQDKTWEQKSRYVSGEGSRYWIFGNNPFKYQILFTDKYVQKALLTGLKLPTPAVLAFIGGGGSSVSTFQEFQVVVGDAPDEFVLKPVSAAGGRGLRKLRKSRGEVLEGNEPIRLEDIWNGLRPNMDRGILMEETAHNNELIRSMNPSSLNTFRVITFQFPDAGWVHLCSYLKVGRQNSAVDNSGAGGLLVRIDSDGRTGRAVDFDTRSECTHHPDSGAVLSDLMIDGFREVISLAVDASAHFPQMGILGWDIALTRTGPAIIEVNASPDCHYPQIAYGGLVTDELMQVLSPKHFFSRYNKRYFYPNHLRDRKGRI